MASSSIDDLPDEALHHILSFLRTTKQRAATSLVSRRWRHLWTHVPSLDFRFDDFPDYSYSIYVSAIHECLRRFSRPLHRFSADLFHPYDYSKAYLTLDRWIRILSTTSLRVLSLDAGSEDPTFVLPESLLSLAPSLRVLKLYAWDLTEFDWAGNPHWRGFERLHTLVLDNVAIFDDQLRSVLAACPSIENLKIYSSQLSIKLSSSVNPRLRMVDLNGDVEQVEGAGPFQVVIDLADLEILLLAGETMWDLRLSASPKLREVGLFPGTAYKMPASLSGVEIMSANASVFHFEYEKRQEFPFPNLKVLFASGVPEYGSLLPFVSFLSRCPSLDILHVSILYYSESDYEDVEFDKLDAGPTSSCRVKTITVMDVTGHKRDKALMKYLLGKMTCLQCLSIVFSEWNRSIICKEEQLLEEVRLFARISPVVDIIVQTRNNISLPDSSYEWFRF